MSAARVASKSAYLDLFGTVTHVLHEVDARVLRVFPDQPESFREGLKDMVERYATQNSWDAVALSLSRGLARRDLEDLIEYGARHRGGIIVDPTGSTPEHQIFQNYQEIRSSRERLVRMNEATSDVLIILYGLQGLDRTVVLELLMRRLRLSEAVLDLLADDTLLNEKRGNIYELITQGRQRFIAANRLFGLVLRYSMREEEAENLIDIDGNKVAQDLFSAVTTLYALALEGERFEMKAPIANLMASMESLPERYEAVRLGFEPYRKATADMIQRVEASATPAPQPSETHDLRHAESPTLRPG